MPDKVLASYEAFLAKSTLQVVTGDDQAGDRGGPQLLWFNEITPVLNSKDFVQGLLIEQSSAVVYGPSNSGKTFWATDLGLHVAAGLGWNGRRVEQGGVFYAALEGSVGFRNRVAAWKDDKGFEDVDLPFVAAPGPLNLREPDDVDRFIEAVNEAQQRMACRLLLIIIDTAQRALAGGNENSPEDMGALVVSVDRIRAETGGTVLLIHHSGKDSAKGARGHSLLQAAIDTEIEVTVDDNGFDHRVMVVKQRELRKGDVFPFTLRMVELGMNRHGEAVTTCLVETADSVATRPSRRQTGHRKRALEVLERLVIELGLAGFAGLPSGCLSVPEKFWRDRFYESAMPGAEGDTKKHAFVRASSALVENHVVGMASGRVWIVEKGSIANRDIYLDR